MSTRARTALGALSRPESAREWLGWAMFAGGIAVCLAAIAFDARPGSLDLGLLQAGAVLGGFAVASAGKALALGRTGALADELARTGAIAVQLLVLAAAVSALQIENPAFYGIVVPLAFAGFLVHQVMPGALRQPFFVLLSIVGIALVFGPADGAWLIALGLALIGVCHLPARWAVRVGALVVIGGIYAWLRTGSSTMPWSMAVWPILGSMFMFRLIAYVYHLKHAEERPSGWRVLAYFFLLPNVTFPLFPVIDFKTFERSYYARAEHAIYQRGVRWMLLGVLHLIAYRLVYHHVVLPETQVRDLIGLSRQVTGTFLLYLRVSGQFHFIIGLLHLFGYALPETHRFFFLSSDFNDFWRRINIYWKDFMMKTFYYPSVFAARRFGMLFAIVAATFFCVFFLNWLFHAYQWFWVLGVTPISATDTVFWAVLGLAVVGNAILEFRRGRQRSLGGPARVTLRDAGRRALRTLGFFVTISVLWSMWSTPTFAQWLTLIDVEVGMGDVAWLFAIAVALLGGLTLFYHRRGAALVDGAAGAQERFSPARAAYGLAAASALLLIASPATFSWASPQVQRFAQSVRVDELNRADAELLTRGYYEQLIGVNRFNGQLWSVYATRSEEAWDPWTAGLVVSTDDYLRRELEPLFGESAPHGWVTTNADGMRDRAYAREAPPGTYRVAVMGASYVAAVKVADGQGFEALAEARIARDRARGEGPNRPIEALNFGVPGYSAFQQLLLLDARVATFSPDAVVLAANQRDEVQGLTYLAWAATSDVELPAVPASFLEDLKLRAGIDSTTTEEQARDRLAPFGREVLDWVYEEFVRRARQLEMEPAWVHVPMAEPADPGIIEPMIAAAERAGFRVYDLGDAIEGRDLDRLAVSEVDRHLNARGNELLAEPFAEVLVELEAGDVRSDG